jgi:hypothetical protein
MSCWGEDFEDEAPAMTEVRHDRPFRIIMVNRWGGGGAAGRRLSQHARFTASATFLPARAPLAGARPTPTTASS